MITDPVTGATYEKRLFKWHIRYLQLAQLVSSWSKDPSTKCGAVIARPNKTVLSVGYNGFPRGCSDHPELYADRERKYDRIVHAELNAILTSPERAERCTLYVWPPAAGPTCARCATAVIQAGIVRVVHILKEQSEFNDRWGKSLMESMTLYGECGIEVISISEELWMKVTNDGSFFGL